MIAPAKYCKVCGTPLKGRRDKKYCNIQCKNQYHLDLKSMHRSEIETDISFLLRNRTVLHELLDQDGHKKRKVKRSILQRMGFRFHNYTGTFLNSRNKMYHYVFDYSWVPFSDQDVLIIKQ